MKPQWMIQLQPGSTVCRNCQRIIPKWMQYFRAARNPDSLDADGYDVCIGCRSKYFAIPPIPFEPSPK